MLKTCFPKIFGLGLKVMRVPMSCLLWKSFTSKLSIRPSFATNLAALPPRIESIVNSSDKALTAVKPIPCKPPATLYPPWPNLPPEWRFVQSSIRASFPSFVGPNGIPRPLSKTCASFPSGLMCIWTWSPWPFKYSSIALDTISKSKWWSPSSSIEPIYIPGLNWIASTPSNDLISLLV